MQDYSYFAQLSVSLDGGIVLCTSQSVGVIKKKWKNFNIVENQIHLVVN